MGYRFFLLICLISTWSGTALAKKPVENFKQKAEDELTLPHSTGEPRPEVSPVAVPTEPPPVSSSYKTEWGLFWQWIHPVGRVPFMSKDQYEISKTGGWHFLAADLTQPIWTFASQSALGFSLDAGAGSRVFPVQSSTGYLIPRVRMTVLLGEIRPYFEKPVLWNDRISVWGHGAGGYLQFNQKDQNNVTNWFGHRWFAGAGAGVKVMPLSWLYIKAMYEFRYWIAGSVTGSIAGSTTAMINQHNFLLGIGVKP